MSKKKQNVNLEALQKCFSCPYERECINSNLSCSKILRKAQKEAKQKIELKCFLVKLKKHKMSNH